MLAAARRAAQAAGRSAEARPRRAIGNHEAQRVVVRIGRARLEAVGLVDRHRVGGHARDRRRGIRGRRLIARLDLDLERADGARVAAVGHADRDVRGVADVGVGRRTGERAGLGAERGPRRLVLDRELEEVLVGVGRLRSEGVRLAGLDARLRRAGNLRRGIDRRRGRGLVGGLLRRLRRIFFFFVLETACQGDCHQKHDSMPRHPRREPEYVFHCSHLSPVRCAGCPRTQRSHKGAELQPRMAGSSMTAGVARPHAPLRPATPLSSACALPDRRLCVTAFRRFCPWVTDIE